MNQKEEKLLREFIRKTMINPLQEQINKDLQTEHKARLWARRMIKEEILKKEFTVINEAKDSAKPHPKTSINFLRDSFRKLLPNLEKDYKMLTTSAEQRESFKNHYLAAVIRMFDQADGLSAAVDVEDYGDLGAEPVLQSPDEAPEVDGGEEVQQASEEGGDELDDLMKDLETLQEADDLELDKELQEVDVDVVSDLKPEEKKTGLEGDIDKQINKKDEVDADREKFGAGVEGDVTGRNKAYDSFRNTNNYLLTNYRDLSNEADREEFKKWCVYNLKLSFDGFEEELMASPDLPDIANPEQQS
jgi:hypothetical protein